MGDRLRNKTAIVTGAGSVGPGVGNGKAAAALFAREGARVMLVDLNLDAAERLETRFHPLDLVLLESGGDNLASTFSPELVDYWIFVIDVSGGGDIPRKRGPGVLQADLLVINKADLAPHVGVDLAAMTKEAREVRRGRPVIVTNCRTGKAIADVVDHIVRNVLFDG